MLLSKLALTSLHYKSALPGNRETSSTIVFREA